MKIFLRSAGNVMIGLMGWAGVGCVLWLFWLFNRGYEWQVF